MSHAVDTVDVWKPVVNEGVSATNLKWWVSRISEASTVWDTSWPRSVVGETEAEAEENEDQKDYEEVMQDSKKHPRRHSLCGTMARWHDGGLDSS